MYSNLNNTNNLNSLTVLFCLDLIQTHQPNFQPISSEQLLQPRCKKHLRIFAPVPSMESSVCIAQTANLLQTPLPLCVLSDFLFFFPHGVLLQAGVQALLIGFRK
jgi:hypothetical protein